MIVPAHQLRINQRVEKLQEIMAEVEIAATHEDPTRYYLVLAIYLISRITQTCRQLAGTTCELTFAGHAHKMGSQIIEELHTFSRSEKEFNSMLIRVVERLLHPSSNRASHLLSEEELEDPRRIFGTPLAATLVRTT